jgi:AAA family ATP:ADP antiporter
VARSGYLRGIAALVFLVAIVTQWTQFQFLLVAQDRFARDADRLTAFLGEWNVYLGVVAFLVQVLVTGPALRSFGIALTILLLPLSLGLGSALVVLFPAFWSVLLTSSLDQSLRFSVDKATFELLYLPLPSSMRGGVKAAIDTVFSRGADAVGGILLGLATTGFGLGFARLPGAGLGLRGLAVLNLVLIAVWVAVAAAVRRGYVNAIRDSLKRHGLDIEHTSTTVLDRSATDVLHRGLETGDEQELLYTLTLLERHHRQVAHPALRSLLDHPSPAVRRRTLALLDAASDPSAIDRAREMLHDDDLEARTEALAYLTHHAGLDPLSAIRELGDFTDGSVRAGMVSFLARPGPTQNIDAARALLDAMVEEPDPDGRTARLEAARLAGLLPRGFGRAIGRLLRDPEVDVASLAIRAVGRTKRAEFLPELLLRLGHPELSDDAARSLAALGDLVVEPLRDRLFAADVPLEVKREIPAVLVRIGSPSAQRALMESLLQGDPILRRRIIGSLNRLRRRQEFEVDAGLVETVLGAEITGHYRSHQILARLQGELAKEDPGLRGLRQSMDEEVERIFGLMSLLSPGDDLDRAHRALGSSDARARANALELLDNILRPPLRRLVVPLVDPHVSLEERAALATRLIGASVVTREEAVATLVGCGDPWLRSCAARIIGALSLRSFEGELDRWREDADPLLREAARAARRQLRDDGAAAADLPPEAPWGDSGDRLGVG